MSERQAIVHKIIMIVGLVCAVGALPFSIKVCHAAMIIMVASWCFEGQWHSKLAILRQSVLLQLITAFILFQLLGLAFADNLYLGWLSLEKKIFFLLLPMVLATTAIKLSAREIKCIVITFVAACFAGTLVCLWHAWHEMEIFLSGAGHINPYFGVSSYNTLNPMESPRWLFFSYVSLAEGIGLHPTYLSLYLCFSIIFLLHLSPVKNVALRTIALLLICYVSLVLVFLSSRIIILGLVLILLAMATTFITSKQRSMSPALIVILFAFVFLIFLNPVSRYRISQEVDSSTFNIQPHREYQNAAEIRASLWWLAFKSLTTSNPFVGVGTGDVETTMAASSKNYGITNINGSFDPHNQFLYSLLANGYPALLLLILCLALPAYFAWVLKDHLLVGFSFIFSLLCLTESAMELQKGIAFYSIFFPLLFFQLHSFQTSSLSLRSILRASN